MSTVCRRFGEPRFPEAIALLQTTDLAAMLLHISILLQTGIVAKHTGVSLLNMSARIRERSGTFSNCSTGAGFGDENLQ
jgi:hypothetical protein